MKHHKPNMMRRGRGEILHSYGVLVTLVTALSLSIPVVHAQSTQGLISGRILDSITGRVIAFAIVSCVNPATSFASSSRTDKAGYYYFPQLSPGVYQLRVAAEGYQTQEIDQLELPVAGRLDLDLRVRPLADVWEAGQFRSVFLSGTKFVVTYFGPDVDSTRSALVEGVRPSKGALDSSVSQVVDLTQILDLPLAGRDVYTMLVTQPGVTADTTTARSLGLTANGQRSSASNFLLDGIESNNYLVSGPLSPIPPEAVQEYRVSTNNFSAEYGGTSGYLANAVTRSGTSEWHGLGYFDLKNAVLNANDFRSNLSGQPRSPVKEIEPGFQLGGPIRRKDLFLSISYDLLRSRNRAAPAAYQLPTTALLAATAPGSIARHLLTEFPGPVIQSTALTAIATFSPPVSVDRSIGLARVDRLFDGGAHRLMVRFAGTGTSRPDFRWSPFQAFTSGIDEQTRSVVLGLSSSLRPTIVNEVRFGNTVDDLTIGRAHPEIPILTSLDGTTLPSSTVFSWFHNRVSSWQAYDNLTLTQGRHVFTVGGGILFRGISGTLTAGAEGQYAFATVSDFASDKANLFRIPLDRQALPTFSIPNFYREYRYRQLYFFAQDTFRLTSRLVLNYGLRYDFYGAPVNTGQVKDAKVQLGPGDDLAARLQTATLVRPPAGNEQLYSPDHNDFAPRLGFSYALPGRAGIIRGAYGIFSDRLIDNVWQNLRNNNFVLPTAFSITAPSTNYLVPVGSVFGSYQGLPVSTIFGDPVTQSQRAPTTMFQPGFRTPYVQSFFLGVQVPLANSWTAEIYDAGSLGRKLLTTDILNRTATGGIGPVFYRSNQGSSSYNALNGVVRYRAAWAQFQAAYTWGHSIDNQSEVLRGDYFNLTATRLTSSVPASGLSAFTRAGDSSADRGSSDFDQRQNLMFFSIWNLPGPSSKSGVLLRNWKVAQLAAFRSGTPFTVWGIPQLQTGILNQRADVVNPGAIYANTPVSGGERLLNRAAFANPTAGRLGITGRNAFTGPGFWNVDLSLSRSFALPFLREGARLTFRVDAFNFLNHANLSVPDSVISSPTFGIARFGRVAADSGLPVLSPVNDTSRQIQLIVRVQF